MNAEERRLLLDLSTAALGALQTSEKIASRVKAVELILRRKSILTGEEINKVEQAFPVNQLLSNDPDKIEFMEKWNNLTERLEDARRRLSEEED